MLNILKYVVNSLKLKRLINNYFNTNNFKPYLIYIKIKNI